MLSLEGPRGARFASGRSEGGLCALATCLSSDVGVYGLGRKAHETADFGFRNTPFCRERVNFSRAALEARGHVFLGEKLVAVPVFWGALLHFLAHGPALLAHDPAHRARERSPIHHRLVVGIV